MPPSSLRLGQLALVAACVTAACSSAADERHGDVVGDGRSAETVDAARPSAADLDGDGAYELVLKWDPSNAKDNSQSGCTGHVYLDAYELDGTRLWRLDLGPNIRAGAHYTQFMVYDLDGDGRAEVALKTAPGTRDGRGMPLALGPAAEDDQTADYRTLANVGGRTGYVLRGPEYLTVFEGVSGREQATVAFSPTRGKPADWGDEYGNRVDRFLAGVAYLDDTGLPSLVLARGYYARSMLTAWNYRAGALTTFWTFDSDQTPRDARGKPFSGQGAHSLSIANVDTDRGQEIVYGAMVIDHDGKGRCSTGFGHGDALHVSDWLPERPGLEVFMPHEDGAQPSYDLHDASSCEPLLVGPTTGADTGRGVAADLTPAPGAELWSAGGPGLLDGAGRRIGDMPGSTNFVAYWDGDDLRELVDQNAVHEYGGRELVRCAQCTANNGTKATPTLVADLLGDYREEVIWRETDSRALRIYTTTWPTERRLYTLMHDPQYRVAIAWQNVAYNQPPHPSFALAPKLAPPARPDIRYGQQ
jgi:rhamnogalacturonan endolyase